MTGITPNTVHQYWFLGIPTLLDFPSKHVAQCAGQHAKWEFMRLSTRKVEFKHCSLVADVEGLPRK